MSNGRIAKIDQFPELKDQLAEMAADNVPQKDMAQAMGVSDRGTISAWLKRPDIQMRVTKLIQERVNRITAKTTQKIEGLLESGKEIATKDLLDIHKTFAGQLLKIDQGADPAEALAQLYLHADENPDLAKALELLSGTQDRLEAADLAESDAPA
jgi:hypothetical protein